MFEDKIREIEIVVKTNGSASQSIKDDFETVYDAETYVDKKMASDINLADSTSVLNLVVDGAGNVLINEHFLKVQNSAVKYYLYYVETYNDGTDDTVVLSGKDNLASAVSLFYSKKGASRDKENLETAIGKVFNTHGGFESEYNFAWDKNPAPEPNENESEE